MVITDMVGVFGEVLVELGVLRPLGFLVLVDFDGGLDGCFVGGLATYAAHELNMLYLIFLNDDVISETYIYSNSIVSSSRFICV